MSLLNINYDLEFEYLDSNAYISVYQTDFFKLNYEDFSETTVLEIGRATFDTNKLILPPNLISLKIYHTNLKNITFEFPKKMRSIYLTNNDINNLKDVKFPESLEILILGNNKLKSIDTEIPDNVYNLSFNNNKIYRIKKIPEGLNLFTITNNNLVCIEKDLIHNNLRNIDLTGNKNFRFKREIFPLTLNKIFMDDQSNVSLTLKYFNNFSRYNRGIKYNKSNSFYRDKHKYKFLSNFCKYDTKLIKILFYLPDIDNTFINYDIEYDVIKRFIIKYFV